MRLIEPPLFKVELEEVVEVLQHERSRVLVEVDVRTEEDRLTLVAIVVLVARAVRFEAVRPVDVGLLRSQRDGTAID